MIALIYGIFVLILIGFVIFSSLNTVDLVSDDYYQKEIAYQNQIERIRRSKNLSQPLSWQYDREKELIIIQFPDTLMFNDITGRIHFFRPSDAGQDRIEPIQTDSDNRQIISTKGIKIGFWRVKITWQYDNREYYDELVIYIK